MGSEGLWIAARRYRRHIPRKQIVSGVVRPALPGCELELRLSDRSILRLHVPDEDDAVALLQALGRDAAHRPATIGVGTTERYNRALLAVLAHLGLLVAVVLGLDRAHLLQRPPPASVLAFMAAQAIVSYLFIRYTRPLEVTVGLDVVVIHYPFSKRVIPWSRIERFELGFHALTLRLAPPPGSTSDDPEILRIPVTNDGAAAQALHDRLIEAQMLRSRSEDAHLGRRVERGGRTLSDWRVDVSKLLTSAGQAYRNAAVSVEQLRALAANPGAPAEQRLGAALALGSANDDVGRTTVRVAARSVVSPKLRIALREALQESPNEEAIEEALAEEAESQGASPQPAATSPTRQDTD